MSASPIVAVEDDFVVERYCSISRRSICFYFLSVWIDYNRGIGQMREWFVKGLSLSGVKPEDVPVELNI